jgi:hypothetical protein
MRLSILLSLLPFNMQIFFSADCSQTLSICDFLTVRDTVSAGWRDLVNAVMTLQAPQIAGNFLTRWGTVGFSRRTLIHGVSECISYLLSTLERQSFTSIHNNRQFIDRVI